MLEILWKYLHLYFFIQFSNMTPDYPFVCENGSNKCLWHLFWTSPWENTLCLQHSLWGPLEVLQYIPRNMHTVTALLCFVVVIH